MRTCLVHLGGLDSFKLNELIDKGHLPQFKSLQENGVFCPLIPHPPIASPAAEVTLLSGLPPHLHGQLTYLHNLPEESSPDIHVLESIEAPWTLLEALGQSSISVGWPFFKPAQSSGVHANFFYLEQGSKASTHSVLLDEYKIEPHEIELDLLQTLAPLITEDERETSESKILQIALADLFSRHAVSTFLLENNTSWQSTWFNYPFLDLLIEAFLPFEPPFQSGRTPIEYKRWSGVLDHAYALLDQCLATLIQLAGEDTYFFLTSAHGMARGNNRPYRASTHPWKHANWLRPEGLLLATGPNLPKNEVWSKRGIKGLVPTLLHAHGVVQKKKLPLWKDLSAHLVPDSSFPEFTTNNTFQKIRIKPAHQTTEPALEAEYYLYTFLAESLQASGSIQDANDTRNLLLKRFPEAHKERLILVESLLKTGEMETALQEAEICADSTPDRAWAQLFLAEIAFEAGLYEKSLNILANPLPGQTASADLLSRRGLAKIKLFDKQSARSDFEAGLSLDPEHAYSQIGLGYCEWAEHRPHAALTWIQRGLKKQPKYYLGWWLLAKILESLEQNEEALDAVQKALSFSPVQSSELYHLAADICRNLPEHKTLSVHYRQAAFNCSYPSKR